MAQYDVHRMADGTLLLDCQSNLLRHLSTRLTVPLLPPGVAPDPAARLNPRFEIDGAPFYMVTQFAAAIPVEHLGALEASLSEHDHDITRAPDVLITGV